MILLTVAVGSLPSAGPAAAGLQCKGKENPSLLEQVVPDLATRSIAIVEHAERGDKAALTSLVSPVARFSIWDGDAGRGRKIGAAGAIEFVQDIAPTGFEYTLSWGGIVVTQICGPVTVTITFSGTSEERGYVADFTYENGILTGANARRVVLKRGVLGPVQVAP